MIFKSLCRHAEIGANSYLLTNGNANVVLDSGMHPEHEGAEAIPHFELLEENSVDGLIITHSHLDHVGTLPVFLADQKKAHVFITPEAADLTDAMLHNSVNVMQSKRIEHGITEYPLFNHEEVEKIVGAFEHRRTERPFWIDPGETMRATFHDAGHILGSVGVTIEANGKRVFYTGDVNFEDATVQKGAVFPVAPVDALIVETTRGAQARRPDYSRQEEENRFAGAIEQVLARGGSVLIPVFAMGKTQEVLAMISRFKEEQRIPRKTPVYMGGLSTKMTHIYDRHANTARRNLPGFRFLKDMEIEGANRKRKGPVPFHNGCIYALSSGMMSENTLSNAFARQGVMENPKHAIFFVGYADPSTPGGVIRAAQQGDDIVLDPKLPPVKLRCQTDIFDFSGHSTREAILDYIVRLAPKKIFLVHGDVEAAEWFRGKIRELLPQSESIIPQPGEEYPI
ncbi:MAG: MBL fold metallo-hydrolase [Verrucomicrobiota bacterium]